MPTAPNKFEYSVSVLWFLYLCQQTYRYIIEIKLTEYIFSYISFIHFHLS